MAVRSPQTRTQIGTMPAGLRIRLRRLPLLARILLVNSAIVALGAILGTIVVVWHVRAYPEHVHYELIAPFMLVGLLLSGVVNYFALRITLAPLDRVQAVVDAVRIGRRDVRAVIGSGDDERFARLAETLNQMLDELEHDARQLHQLSGAILQAQEDERQRVARELHDEAAQALTSLLVRIRLLERADDPLAAQQHTRELRELTAGALEQVRRVALELRPTILDDLGLLAALEWRVDEFNAAGTAHATLYAECRSLRLPHQVELVCFRVVQEALTNVSRYANAAHVMINLRCEGVWLALEISDDGQGFDPTVSASGLGLRGMRERLALVDGTLAISSHPGAGTRIVARVPGANT
ncbi:MAG: sensor histidine kinase [Oscillochloris sp.]|nr:sensor histidine kinase [Oscillochloris sp.]